MDREQEIEKQNKALNSKILEWESISGFKRPSLARFLYDAGYRLPEPVAKEKELTWGTDFDINGDLTPSGIRKSTQPVEPEICRIQKTLRKYPDCYEDCEAGDTPECPHNVMSPDKCKKHPPAPVSVELRGKLESLELDKGDDITPVLSDFGCETGKRVLTNAGIAKILAIFDETG